MAVGIGDRAAVLEGARRQQGRKDRRGRGTVGGRDQQDCGTCQGERARRLGRFDVGAQQQAELAAPEGHQVHPMALGQAQRLVIRQQMGAAVVGESATGVVHEQRGVVIAAAAPLDIAAHDRQATAAGDRSKGAGGRPVRKDGARLRAGRTPGGPSGQKALRQHQERSPRGRRALSCGLHDR